MVSFLMDNHCIVSNGSRGDLLTARGLMETVSPVDCSELYVLTLSKHPSANSIIDCISNITGWLQSYTDCLVDVNSKEKIFDCNKYFIKINNE